MAKINSQKLRDSAMGQACTLNIAGVCNYDTATTVLCHLPDESSGLGKKSDDISACFGCSCCHDSIDGRNHKNRLEWGEKEFYMRRAQIRTWRIWIDEGLLVLR